MVALSELLSLLDGSHGSVDGGAAVVDQVHVGDTRVVDEAARQVNRRSRTLFVAINLIQNNCLEVEVVDQVEFKEDCSHSNQLILENTQSTNRGKSILKK